MRLTLAAQGLRDRADTSSRTVTWPKQLRQHRADLSPLTMQLKRKGAVSGMLVAPLLVMGADMADIPERALWRTVLSLALADADKGQNPNWVGSFDFEVICALADVEPEALLRARGAKEGVIL